MWISEIANCVDLVSMRVKDGETAATVLTDKGVTFFINYYLLQPMVLKPSKSSHQRGPMSDHMEM